MWANCGFKAPSNFPVEVWDLYGEFKSPDNWFAFLPYLSKTLWK